MLIDVLNLDDILRDMILDSAPETYLEVIRIGESIKQYVDSYIATYIERMNSVNML